MNKVILQAFLFLFAIPVLSQCAVNTYIQDNYEFDAKILALRAIQSNPADPDYDNPFLPDLRVQPYLEKLSAIYENSINSLVIDEIFNDFNIHVNEQYLYHASYKTIVLRVSTSLPWLNDFITTGISGVSELDNLLSMYQLTLSNYNQLNSCACTHLHLETNFDFLNMHALINDFESINDIDFAEATYPNLSYRFNYTGIPYSIYDSWDPDYYENVEACDIFINENNEFVFSLHGGDCIAGCFLSEYRFVEVNDNCEVISARLSLTENKMNSFRVFPNPVVDRLKIQSNNANEIRVSMFDLSGKNILPLQVFKNAINVSTLNSGVYILKIEQNNHTVSKKIVIK